MFSIPEDFVRDVIAAHAEAGRSWLKRLPTILANCEQRWQLTFDSPFAYQSYAHHYIAPAVRRDGTAVVVKVHSPTNEFIQEAEALRLYNGRGIVRLLDCDMQDRVLLQERLKPGTSLKEVKDDEEAMSHAAAVMQQLWRPVPSDHAFPSIIDWGRGFQSLRQRYEGGNGPFPGPLLEEAESLFADLSESMTEQVLLHGDLHHENILAAEREPWLAIDPKGVIGEPAYETGALLRNHLPDVRDRLAITQVLTRRIDQLAEALDLERALIRNWAVAQAVLSVWWTIEDKEYVPEDHLMIAELLASIQR